MLFEMNLRLMRDDHGEGWFAAGLPHIRTTEDFQKVFNGAMCMLEARA
jgi:hypothetical protein